MALGHRPMRQFQLKAKKKPLSLADLSPERRVRSQNDDDEPGGHDEASNDNDGSRLYSEWPRKNEDQERSYTEAAINMLRDWWPLAVLLALILILGRN
ncbi:unnamed protein product [Clonostachys rosea]|uniref:Uncharacterized protein n=1 Tax=Bionectria ochroleuca TaxID=29856 RepID=A0ABY6TYL9_BIOOC|nr:unnamed protein product [Clonostachys rosea]